MNDAYECEEARAHYHQVRRGDVTPDELLKYDDHVSDCDACQAFVRRMDGMLDSAIEIDPVDEIEIDRDALFARIMGEVDDEEVEPASAPVLVEVDDEPLEVPVSPRRWSAVALLLAACVVAGIGIVYWMERAPDAPLELVERDDRETRTNSRGADKGVENEAVGDERGVVVAARVSLDELEPTTGGGEKMRIFSARSTEVEVSSRGDETTVALEDGTVLVEFTPVEPGRDRLSVVAGDLSVKVVGTIFYVQRSAQKSVVGVVTGKVEVTPSEGPTLYLTDGQEYSPGEGIRSVGVGQREVAEAYIDVEEHEARLAKGVPAPSPAQKPAQKLAQKLAPKPNKEGETSGSVAAAEPEPDGRRGPRGEQGAGTKMSVLAQTLRDQASEAVRMREYREASQLLEELIVELPSGHSAAMSARLDLSRIYMRQLDAPERAVPHLKRFIVDRPDDPAAPSARQTLCRILEAQGETDAACEAP